jgi:hypothetical protein
MASVATSQDIYQAQISQIAISLACTSDNPSFSSKI